MKLPPHIFPPTIIPRANNIVAVKNMLRPRPRVIQALYEVTAAAGTPFTDGIK